MNQRLNNAAEPLSADTGCYTYFSISNSSEDTFNRNNILKIPQKQYNFEVILPEFDMNFFKELEKSNEALKTTLKFLNSTFSCIENTFSTDPFMPELYGGLVQILETLCLYEAHMKFITTEKMECKDSSNIYLSSSLSPPNNDNTCTEKLAAASSENNLKEFKIAEKYCTEFNLILAAFLCKCDQLCIEEKLNIVFDNLCKVNTDKIPVEDLGDLLLRQWRKINELFGQNTDFGSLKNTAVTKTLTVSPCKERSTKSSFSEIEERSIKRRNKPEQLLLKSLTNIIEMKSRSLVLKPQQSLSECIEKYRNRDDDDGILLFDCHKNQKERCVCYGGESSIQTYFSNYHLEAGKPFDIINYIIKLRVFYDCNTNYATQVDMFLVTFRCYINLDDLLSVIIEEIFLNFPENGNEPNGTFKGAMLLFIDVLNGIFEPLYIIKSIMANLWKLYYTLVLAGMYNFALKTLKNIKRMYLKNIRKINSEKSLMTQPLNEKKKTQPKDYVDILLNLSNWDLAKQITYTDFDLLKKITSAEMLTWFRYKYSSYSEIENNAIMMMRRSETFSSSGDSQNYFKKKLPKLSSFGSKKKEDDYRLICENVNNMVIRFDYVSNLAIKIINYTKSKIKKTRSIIYLIETIKYLLVLNNIFSAFAVFTGINNSDNEPIIKSATESNTELKNIWKTVESLMDPSGSYKNYRNHIKYLNPPFIPYTGVTMQDINFLYLHTPNFIKEFTPKNVLFENMVALHLMEINELEKQISNDQPCFSNIPSSNYGNNMYINIRKFWQIYNILKTSLAIPKVKNLKLVNNPKINEVLHYLNKLQKKDIILNN